MSRIIDKLLRLGNGDIAMLQNTLIKQALGPMAPPVYRFPIIHNLILYTISDTGLSGTAYKKNIPSIKSYIAKLGKITHLIACIALDVEVKM